MSTSPGVACRASTVGRVVAVLLGLAALGGCGGSGGSTSSSSTAVTTSRPGVTGPNSLPEATIPATGCTSASGATATVTLTVDERGFSPRCVTVGSRQTLRIRNTGKSFHNVVVEDLNSNLPPGGTQTWDEVGRYLAPGNYVIYSGTERNQARYPAFHSTLVLKDT